jgi:hypothetical protein
MMETSPDGSSAPRFAFEMALYSSKLEVSTTQPCHIHFTIRRLPDSQKSPCIISWNDFSEIFYEGSLELYHETDQGSKKVDTGPFKSPPPDPLEDISDQIRITPQNRGPLKLHEIKPGSSVTLRHILPESYHRCLISGQKYNLRWSGRYIKHWTWARLYYGNKISFRNQDHLHLPPTEGFAFSVVDENKQWPDRKSVEERFGFNIANTHEWIWRREQEALQSRTDNIKTEDNFECRQDQEEGPKDPALPTFSATLEASPTFSVDKPFKVALHIKYEETFPKLDPVTFHLDRFHSHFDLLQRESKQGLDMWERCPTENTTGFMIVDDPDVRVNVAQHESFASLKQGETVTEDYNLHHPSGGHFPSDMVAGDYFRIRWTGTTLDWWDWGTSEDHRDTEALLPCFISAAVIDCNKGMGNKKVAIRRARDIYAVVVDST